MNRIALEVLKVHKNKITPPTKNYHAYKTRVNGEKVKQIVRASEDDLYDALYEFYFGQKVKAPTLQEAIWDMKKSPLQGIMIVGNTKNWIMKQ